MATAQEIASTDAAILSRLIRPEQDDLSAEAAQALLKLRFNAADLARLHHLVTKNQDGLLTSEEQSELESYLRIGSFVDLMQSKARRSLKKRA